MRGASQNFISIISENTPNDVFLHLVSVTWDDGEVSRWVKNYEGITSRGDYYTPSSFNVTLPSDPGDEIPTLNFSFALGDKITMRRLRNSTVRPTLRLEIVLASDPNIVELGPFDFDIRDFDMKGDAVVVKAGYEPLLDYEIPQLSYSPPMFPGLFSNYMELR